MDHPAEWMYALLRGFLATTRKHVDRQKLSQNKKRHCIFCQKEVYLDSKRYIGILLLVFLCPQQLIFVECTVNWRKIHGICLFGSFELRHGLFAGKVYRDSKRTMSASLSLGFVVPSMADFRSMYRKLVENTPYNFVWHF